MQSNATGTATIPQPVARASEQNAEAELQTGAGCRTSQGEASALICM